MKKEYTSLDSLRKDWYTTEKLLKVLEESGYAHDPRVIIRWEREGIIPKATRVKMCGANWRVYTKNGNDFITILQMLEDNEKIRRFV